MSGDHDAENHPLVAASSATEEPVVEQPKDIQTSHEEPPPPPYESIILGDAAQPDSKPTSQEPTATQTDAAESALPGAGSYGAPANTDFRISVIEPLRQGEGVAAYVSYKVISTTNLSQYQRRHNEVIRRFRDFVWLQRRLRKQYRGIIVPALPEKNVLEKYKMTTEFINQRRAALEVFLNRVAAHRMLRTSADLHLFLEANETEFAIEVSRTQEDSPAIAATSSASGAARKTLDGAVRLFRSLGSSAGGLVASSARPVRDEEEEDTEYLRARAYITELEPYLLEVHKQSSRVVRHHAELGVALEEFGAAVAALQHHDGGVPSVSHLFADLEKNTSAAAAVSKRTSENLSQILEAPMKDFYRTVRAAKKVTTDRANVLSELQQAKLEVDTRSARLTKLRGTPGILEERIAEAERDYRNAQIKLQEMSEVHGDMIAKMRGELARFQQERALDLAQVLREFAKEELRSSADTAKAWQSKHTRS